MVKVLTILQPFAWAVVNNVKGIENRSWPTDYRGLLAIHAGKSREYVNGTEPHWWHYVDGFTYMPGLPASWEEIPWGAIVGTVDLVDCLPKSKAKKLHPIEEKWIEGPWCWVFENPRKLAKPIPCSGQVRLWALDQDPTKWVYHQG